jgi:hypothetical protein
MPGEAAMSTALYASLDSLAAGIEEMGQASPEWWQKMQHKLPHARSVDRVQWLTERMAGQTILHMGCAGPLHALLQKVCARVYGLDREPMETPECHVVDLDRLTGPLPVFEGVETVLCAEVLEHLGNPRFLLESLKEGYPTQTLIVTAPNAFSEAARVWVHKGYESVNKEHLWWPSWHTMKTLLAVSGYTVQEFLWYHGAPPTSEGLIFVCQPQDDAA